jgi:hypothetical protein
MSLTHRFLPCLALLSVLILATQARPQEPAAPAAPEQPAAANPPAAPDQPAAAEQPPTASPQSLWEDMLHFIRVARPDLAQSYGEALLKATATDDTTLLDIVQNSPHRDADQQLLLQAQQIDKLKPVADQLIARLRTARMKMARDKDRVLADIANLTKGTRANDSATARLRAAGQFAAPYLLATLVDDRQEAVHPYVLTAMIAIGRPMAAPLAAALPHLDPRAMMQVADALAEIGYAQALPALKAVLEDPKVNPAAHARVQTAYDRLAQTSSLPADTSAADLYLLLAQNCYADAGTRPYDLPGYDAQSARGVIWEYTRDPGLMWDEVPTNLFGDVLAMRAAKQALRLKPDLGPALSLWLAANLSREARLAPGQTDATYHEGHPASYFIRIAGPARQLEVLDMALAAGDQALALKAIDALSGSASIGILTDSGQRSQPLIRALFGSDRRLSYAAAFALARAHPQAPFPGSPRLVWVLTDALRQTATKYAVVVGSNPEQRNQLAGILAGKDLGYLVDQAPALPGVIDLLATRPGVDVLVVTGDADTIRAFMRQSAQDPRLAGVPVVAVASEKDQSVLVAAYLDEARKPIVTSGADPAKLTAALEQATKTGGGAAISQEEATGYTLTSLAILRDLAACHSSPFHVTDAQAALILALKDPRAEVIAPAAAVLALLPTAEAQKALADAALDAARPEPQRIALLNSLADSATQIGCRLDKPQVDQLVELVQGAQGDLATAAARVYGALAMPASAVVQALTK